MQLVSVGAILLTSAAHGVDCYVVDPKFSAPSSGALNHQDIYGAVWAWVSQIAQSAALQGVCQTTRAGDPLAVQAAHHVACFVHAVTGRVNALWPVVDDEDARFRPAHWVQALPTVPVSGEGRWIFQPDLAETGERPTCHQWTHKAPALGSKIEWPALRLIAVDLPE